jgi:hypothetical protein
LAVLLSGNPPRTISPKFVEFVLLFNPIVKHILLLFVVVATLRVLEHRENDFNHLTNPVAAPWAERDFAERLFICAG